MRKHVMLPEGDPIYSTVDKNGRITIPKYVFDNIPNGIFRRFYNFNTKQNEHSYLLCMFHGDYYSWNKPIKTRRIKVPYEPGTILRLELIFHQNDVHSEYYLECHKECPYING